MPYQKDMDPFGQQLSSSSSAGGRGRGSGRGTFPTSQVQFPQAPNPSMYGSPFPQSSAGSFVSTSTVVPNWLSTPVPQQSVSSQPQLGASPFPASLSQPQWTTPSNPPQQNVSTSPFAQSSSSSQPQLNTSPFSPSTSQPQWGTTSNPPFSPSSSSTQPWMDIKLKPNPLTSGQMTSPSLLPTSVSEARPLGHGSIVAPNMSLKVMVYCWNEESIQFAPRIQDEDMKKYFGGTFSTWIYSGSNGVVPDFVLNWVEEVKQGSPDVVFFAFQEAQSDDRLSDEALVFEMNTINYVPLKATSLTGIGVTTFKYQSAGKARGLRNVVFVKRNMVETIAKEESLMRTNIGDNYQSYYSLDQFRSKGGIVSFVKFPGYGPIAFVNCHLPFQSSTLMTYKKSKDIFSRKIGVLETDAAYNTIIRELIWMNSYPAFQGEIYRPHAIILCGDLNYRVTIPPEELKAGYDIRNEWDGYMARYAQCDEYRQEKTIGNIYPMSEGVERKGPQFYPTDKMVKGRNPGDTTLSAYNLGKEEQRQPSWTDRILYNTTPGSTLSIQCTSYDRMDIGNMRLSDHAGVKATFNFIRN